MNQIQSILSPTGVKSMVSSQRSAMPNHRMSPYHLELRFGQGDEPFFHLANQMPEPSGQKPLAEHSFEQFMEDVRRNPWVVMSDAELASEMNQLSTEIKPSKHTPKLGLPLDASASWSVTSDQWVHPEMRIYFPPILSTQMDQPEEKRVGYLKSKMSPYFQLQITAGPHNNQHDIVDFQPLPPALYRLKWVELPKSVYPLPTFEDDRAHPLQLFAIRHPSKKMPPANHPAQIGSITLSSRDQGPKRLDERRYQQMKRWVNQAAKKHGIQTVLALEDTDMNQSSRNILMALLKRYRNHWPSPWFHVLNNHVRALQYALPEPVSNTKEMLTAYSQPSIITFVQTPPIE